MLEMVQGVGQTNRRNNRGDGGGGGGRGGVAKKMSSVTIHPLTLVVGAGVVWSVSWLVNSDAVYGTLPIIISDAPLMKQSSCIYETNSNISTAYLAKSTKPDKEEKSYEEEDRQKEIHEQENSREEKDREEESPRGQKESGSSKIGRLPVSGKRPLIIGGKARVLSVHLLT